MFVKQRRNIHAKLVTFYNDDDDDSLHIVCMCMSVRGKPGIQDIKILEGMTTQPLIQCDKLKQKACAYCTMTLLLFQI